MNIGTFLQNFFYAYLPPIGKDRQQKKDVHKIINRLKKDDRLLVNPVQMKAHPLFLQLLEETAKISSRLKVLYEESLEGTEKDRERFELSLCDDLLGKGNLSIELMHLSQIVKSAHDEGQGGINTVDRIFKSRMKYFSHKSFSIVKKQLERNLKFSALCFYNFQGLEEKIQNNPDLRIAEKEIQDLFYIVSSLPDKTFEVKKDYPLIHILEQSVHDDSMTIQSVQKDFNRLSEIFNGPFSEKFLRDIICLLLRQTEFEAKKLQFHSTFPKEIYDNLVEKYRLDREKFINDENEKLLQSRMNALFKDRHLRELQVYNRENSNVLHQGGLPTLKYVIPMRIISSFNKFFYHPIIQPVLQEFQVEGEFFEKKQKTEFQEAVEAFDMLSEKVGKFDEDLAIPSFSELLPLLKALRDAFLDNKSKTRGREAVRKVNERADRIIQDTFKQLISLHGLIMNINVDINAAVPRLLSNTLYLKNNKEDLNQGLEEAGEKLNRYIKLLKIFALHVDQAKRSLEEEDQRSE